MRLLFLVSEQQISKIVVFPIPMHENQISQSQATSPRLLQDYIFWRKSSDRLIFPSLFSSRIPSSINAKLKPLKSIPTTKLRKPVIRTRGCCCFKLEILVLTLNLINWNQATIYRCETKFIQYKTISIHNGFVVCELTYSFMKSE